jgi:cation transport regulator
MPYSKNSELPTAVKDNLPEAAQTIWRKVANSAEDQYDEDSKIAATAWAAVKQKYKKNEDGEWVAKIQYVKKDAKARYTLGIVYEPDELDTDNEFSTADEIEKAAHDFMRELQGRRGLAKAGLEILSKVKEAMESETEVKLEVDKPLAELAKRGVSAMHIEDLEDAEIVESFIAPTDMKIGKQAVKKGSWLAGIIWPEDVFKKIESGEWTGYSMGGTAHKVAA